MKVVLLTPGTGTFYCGSSIRDNALAKGLRALGHEVILLPLYLPIVHDDSPASPAAPLFTGGLNMYLQHKLGICRNLPRSFTRHLDNEALLRKASEFMGMTRIRDLGTMTLDSYRGVGGNQQNEWRRLLAWIRAYNPDAVILSNGLLCGVARDLKEQKSQATVIATLQGEDSFLDSLPESFRARSWAAFRECCPFVDAFVAVSEFYGNRMRDALALESGRLEVIYPGVDTRRYPGRAVLPEVPTIGFLARLCKGKGLETLVQAFLLLAERKKVPQARLHITGTATRADTTFLKLLKSRIAAHGMSDRVTIQRNVDFGKKIEFLSGLSVLSVPATYGEAFGLYVAEAMACGVPLVQPDHGPFPETVGKARAGHLVAPDDVTALAAGLERVLLDTSMQIECAENGRKAALDYFDSRSMAKEHVRLLQRLC